MRTVFLHTADWQLGKPFAGVEDDGKRALLQNERISAVDRLGIIAKENGAKFILVAGDLFDSTRATKSTVSAACSAIGAIGIPVYAIPGNHDFGGAAGLWEQDFFMRERDQLAPNLRIFLKPEPVELDTAVIFPCPLLRRREAEDPTAWLRRLTDLGEQYAGKPRIVLAHGSTLDFGFMEEDEGSESETPNLIDLTKLPIGSFDYVALGDWHGTKKVAANAWYAGTPEIDRFVKGGDHDPGNVLIVEAERGQDPVVRIVKTSAIGWHEIEFQFADDTSLSRLRELVDEKIEKRAKLDLLKLRLGGALGIEASSNLEKAIDTWTARLLRLKIENKTLVAPTGAELEALTRRSGDPLIALVATKLAGMAAAGGDGSQVARIALRELHGACVVR